MRTLDVRVSGVTFNGRQTYLEMLNGGEPCRIIPEPENPYDKNALAVHVSFNGEILHIGYIPKETAALIAPYLEGESVMCDSLEITGGFETNPGERAYFGARVRVTIPGDWDTTKMGQEGGNLPF